MRDDRISSGSHHQTVDLDRENDHGGDEQDDTNNRKPELTSYLVRLLAFQESKKEGGVPNNALASRRGCCFAPFPLPLFLLLLSLPLSFSLPLSLALSSALHASVPYQLYPWEMTVL